MTTAYTSLLGLALPVTGELSGTWGDTVNNSITSLLDSAVSGTTTISADADITLTTTTGAANEAREAILLWTAGGTVTRNITAPAQSKTYIVINKSSSTQSIVLRGAGPTTGVTVIKGEYAVCAWNGTDFVKVSSNQFTALTGTVPVANGGTGITSGTSGGVLAFTAAGTIASSAALTSNAIVLGGGAGASPTVLGSLGTTATVLHGNASGAPTFGAVALASDVSGTLPIANGGTGASTLAGANLPVTNVANTFTGLQTFSGTSSNASHKATNMLETATVSATAATGTINFDNTTQSVLYYTSNASGNFTLNFRGSSGTTLNTVMSTGESLSATFLVTNGTTAYYNSAVTVDGVSVTPKWQGGTAPTSGNASSIDSYTYVIIKTGSAAFTVLASQTKFA